MSLTSDELNFLVYRYLHESGFRHAAYTFGCESLVAKSNINGSKIAPGELVNLVQKGIMYSELERSVADDGSVVDAENFMLLRTSSDGKQLKRAREEAPVASAPEDAEPTPAAAASVASSSACAASSSGASGAPSAAKLESIEPTPEEQVTTLAGHTSEVFICAWSPTSLQLASGSGDSTARIWQVPDGPCGKAQAGQLPEPVVLQHFSGDKEKSKDVTTLDWNHDGTALATGSYDGQARVWSATGKLTATLSKHKGPIFSLKWNRTGQYLLSGSVDKTAVIWDTATGSVKQEFALHKEPTLDVDWRDDDSFASCSTDKMIYVCKLGQTAHLKSFKGHLDEVNAIKWDPSGRLLASCSDDYTAKVWSMKYDTCVQDLREHTREIYTIKWSPTGPGSTNPSANLVLASASFDATIRVWEPETGKSLHVLDKHRDPVYSVAFSADGQYLASGSFDRCLHIWSIKDGSLIKTYKGSGGIFEVCWNADGTKVAACFSTHIVSVIDVRM
mmetsp:Transcript_53287/g.122461  ORF Transcript_53287/g.122461 Transcript_53287/m.122461 type:complete len:504 (-) Transcript_53287:158-1669(-)